MRILLYLAISTLSLCGFSQPEFVNSSTAIPPAKSGIGSAPLITAPSVFAPKAEAKSTSSWTIGEEKKDLMTTNSDFANPGDLYVKKLNKKEGGEDMRVFRQNQYLGEYKTISENARIVYRDFGEVDGDKVRVWVNGHVAVSEIYLTGNFQVLNLALTKGFNKVDFEALNQGLVGPNTAQFQVFDDAGQTLSSNQWNLATGFKATIMIIKE